MKTKFTFILVLIFAIVGVMLAQAGPKRARELADYTPRTLEEIAQLQGRSAENFNRNVVIHGEKATR